MGSNVDEILSHITITAVAESLGLKVKMRRCQATWRPKADGWNVSLNDAKGVWFDHARGEGGGVLDLVVRIRDCTRLDALQWLSYLTGVPLYNPSVEDRQALERKLREAENEGRAFIDWRYRSVELIRELRDEQMAVYRGAVRYLLNHPDPEPGDFKYELAEKVFDSYWQRVEQADRALDVLRDATATELLPVFRSNIRRKAEVAV